MAGKKSFSIRNMAFTALFAAIICILAPISVPLPGLVPISLGTFAIYLGGAIFGAKRGVVAVAVYILLGAVGLPVFTGYMGGIAKVLGVTGGYIIGYIPLVLLTGIFSEKKRFMLPIGMVLGTIALYSFGTVWYMIMTGSELVPALLSCAIPFLPGDAIKMVVACAISIPVKQRLKKQLREFKEG